MQGTQYIHSHAKKKCESVWFKTKLISQFLTLSVLLAQPFSVAQLYAAPEGGNVVGGSGAISKNNLTTTINQNTQNLAIDWKSFDVNTDERVHFVQPNSSSIALNRILGNNGSTIQGRIDANGQVILVNPNGVLFTSTAVVNAGGLIASSLDMTPANFMNGNYIFNEVIGADGQVINSGLINASLGDLGTGGNVALIGKQVKNDGLISANLGSVVLAAGKQSILTFDNNGLIGVSVTKEVLQQELGLEEAVINSGEIKATGGRVLLTASTSQDVFSSAVNNGALDAASSVVVNADGSFTLGGGADVLNTGSIDVSSESNSRNSQRIILLGENVTSSGSITADTQNGIAGEIELHATNTTLLTENSITSAQALNSGLGGVVKLLGNNVGLFDSSTIDVSGFNGGGQALIGGDYRGENNKLRNATATFLGLNATVNANAISFGNAGRIILWGNELTKAFGTINARGGILGGDGGFVETSAKVVELNPLVNVSALLGDGGTWLIDPNNIEIFNDTGPSCPTSVICSDNSTDISESSDVFSSNNDNSRLDNDALRSALNSSGVTVIVETSSGLGATEGAIDKANMSNGGGGNIWISGEIDFDPTDLNEFRVSERPTLELRAHHDIIIDGRIRDSSTSDRDDSNDSRNGRDVINLRFLSDYGTGGTAGGDVIVNARIDTNGGYFYADSNRGDVFINNNIDTRGGNVDLLGTNITINHDDSNAAIRTRGGDLKLTAATAGTVTITDSYLRTDGGGLFEVRGGNLTTSTIDPSRIINTGGGNVNLFLSGAINLGAPIETGGGNLTIGNVSGTNIIPSSFTTSGLGTLTTAGGNIDIRTLFKGTSDANDGQVNIGAAVTTEGGAFTVGYTPESIFARSYNQTATVSTAGAEDVAGGDININVLNTISSVGLSSNGGNGSASNPGRNGQNAGAINLSANSDISVTGNVTAVGGNARDTQNSDSTFVGGNGGTINIDSATGDVSLSGVSSNGGDGDSQGTGTGDIGNGGNAGTIDVITQDTINKSITLSGNITAQGGALDGSSNTRRGTNGNGNDITFSGRVVLNSTDISVDATVVPTTPFIAPITAGNVIFNNLITGNSTNNLSVYANDITFLANVGSLSASIGDVALLSYNDIDAGTNNFYVKSFDVSSTGTVRPLTFRSGSINTNGTAGSIGGSVTINAINTINVTDINTFGGVATAAGLNGGDVLLSAADITFGNINSSGSNAVGTGNAGSSGGLVDIDAIENGANTPSIIINGDINAEAGSNTGGAAGTSQTADITLTSTTTSVVNVNYIGTFTSNVNVTGDISSTDTLVASNQNNTWTVFNSNAGSLNTKLQFSEIENLTGNSQDDLFTFTNPSASLSGLIDGAGDSKSAFSFGIGDVVDKSALTGIAIVDEIGVTVTGIEQLIGNNTNSQLKGLDGQTNTWVVQSVTYNNSATEGTNDGTLNSGISFVDYNSLLGGNAIDNFTIQGGNTVKIGSIDGGTTILNDLNTYNSLTGRAAESNWSITAPNQGQVTYGTPPSDIIYVQNFSNIQTLNGSDSGIDRFTFNVDPSASNLTITGGNGGFTDEVILGSSLIDITLVAGSFIEIENYVGNANPNTFQGFAGAGTTNNWIINGNNSGSVNGFIFSNFYSLLGGASGSTDNFTFVGSGQITGIAASIGPPVILARSGIDGNGGTDTITGPDGMDNAWIITGPKAGTLNAITSFVDIDTLVGSNFNDTFTFNESPNTALVTIIGGSEQIGGQDILQLGAGLSGVTLVAGDFTGDFTGIERYVGNASLTNTLQGASGSGTTNTWTIENFGIASDGVNDGKIVTGGNTTEFIDFALLQGGIGGSTDNFTFVGAASLTGATGIDGFGGVDTINAPNGINITWVLDGANSGSFSSSSFTDIDTLNGSNLIDTFNISASYIGVVNGLSGNDIFNINASFSGSLDGGANNDTFNITSNFAGSITGGADNDTFNILTTGLTLSQTLNGGLGTDTIVAANEDNYWAISGLDVGTVYTNVNQNVARSSFSSVENLTGGSSADIYDLSNPNADITGLINGGAFILNNITTYNTLIARDAVNDWTIQGLNAGILVDNVSTNQYANFSSIQNLTGALNASDSFVFNASGNLTGLLDGRGGNDTVDVVAMGSVSVEIGNLRNNYLNVYQVENIQARRTSNNSLYARAGANTWLIQDTDNIGNLSDGADDGILNGTVTFINFRNLTGTNDVTDNFVIEDNSRVTGKIDGGTFNSAANYNTLTGQNLASDWVIDNQDHGYISYANTANRYVNEFSNIQTLTGGSAADKFTISTNVAVMTDTINGGITDLLNSSTFNTFAGFNIASAWTIDGANSGSVRGTSFNNVQNLTGAASNSDSFTYGINGSLTGLINGNSTSGNLINLEAILNNVTMNAGTNFINIGQINANNNALYSNILIGTTVTNFWNISGDNVGTLNSSINFSGFETLVGNDTGAIPSRDEFTFTALGTLSGYVDGAGGAADKLNVVARNSVDVFISNSNPNTNNAHIYAVNIETIDANAINSYTKRINGGHVNTVWLIDGVNTGTLTFNTAGNNSRVQTIRFNNFNNILAGYRDDRFQFVTVSGIDGRISGLIDANESDDPINNPDNDQIDYSLQKAEKTISLSPGSLFGSVDNIEGIVGNGINMTLEGDNIANVWDILGVNSGVINYDLGANRRVTFSGFNFLKGNAQQDIFNVKLNPNNITENGSVGTIDVSGNIIGEIFGAGGNDMLNVDLSGAENGQIRFDGGGQNDVININTVNLTGAYNGRYIPNNGYTYKNITNSYDQIDYQHSSLSQFTVNYRRASTVNDLAVAQNYTINGTAGNDIINLETGLFQVSSTTNPVYSSNSVNYSGKLNIIVDGDNANNSNDTLNLTNDLSVGTNDLTISVDSVVGNGFTLMASQLNILNSGNIDSVNRLQTTVDRLSIVNSGDVYLSDTDGIELSALNTNSLVDIQANGRVFSTAALNSSSALTVNTLTGDIDLLNLANNLTGNLTLNAPNGNVTLNNSTATKISGIVTNVLNINSTGGLTQTGAITATTANLISGSDITLALANDFDILGINNAVNVRVNDVDDLTISNITAAGFVDITSNGLTLGTINSNDVRLNSGSGSIAGTGTNITSNGSGKINLTATGGISIGLNLNGTLEATNSGAGDIDVRKTGDITLENITNNNPNGGFNLVSNGGNVTVKKLNLNSDNIGATVFFEFLAQGNVYGDDATSPNITANQAIFKMNLSGSVGRSTSDPINLDVKDYIEVTGALGTYIRFYNGVFDGIFRGENDYKNIALQIIDNLAGQQLIQVESLAEIDPAIFTDVRNYSNSDIALMMPSDQRYDISDEEEDDEEAKEKREKFLNSLP